jgi:hypothetical protein
MDTLNFLERVLPSEGTYCASVAFQGKDGKPGIRNKFFGSVKDLADFSYLVSERDTDVYYALATFNEKDGELRRKQDFAHQLKVLAIDVDVGKARNSYATRKDALAAVVDFVTRAKLPEPVIVSSGAGFHCYWVLSDPIVVADWQPLADALKLCWQSYGLNADPAVTADSARVLRPVGTKHLKSGKLVSVVRDAQPVEYSAMLLALSQFYKTAQAVPDFVKDRKAAVSLAQPVEHAPAVGFHVASKCKQIAEAIKKPEKVDEPLWYTIMGVAAHTTDPQASAIQWSKGHPSYSEADTLAKLEQWKANATGPATCARFASLNPAGCNGCPYKGRVTTPVSLGRAYAEAPIDVSAPDPVAQQVELPRPYKRTASGIKYTMDDTDIDVCPFDIYPIGYGKDEALGYETVRYHWNRPHVGWTLLSFRQALLTDGHRDFATVMADNGIVLRSQKQTEDFRTMLRSYMDELRQRRAMSNLYTSMGWKENATQFVMGDTVIRTDATGAAVEEASSLSSHANKADMYGTKGTLQAWKDGTEILDKANMPWHMFTLNMGFAAPLFNFTGLKGLTLSLYGPTGGGKTLSQYFVQSIYGDPDKLHFAAKFTQNTLFSRLGLYNNLPMTIDEATMFNDKEVGDFLYWVSQGRDKARLNRNADEREAKTWATPVIVSTNVSLHSKLVSSGVDTDAQMARLLEVRIPPHILFKQDTTAGQKIYAHLMSNYGHAGREFVKELVRIGDARLREMIDDARKTFGDRYGAHFAGEERYWETAIVLQDLAASIADRLGLIKYDYKKGTRWVLEQLGSMRYAATENRSDSFDLLSEYINEVSDCTVTILHTGNKAIADHSRSPRGELRARFEVYRNKYDEPFSRGALYIDRSHFRKWLSMRGADFKSLLADFDKDNINITPKSGRYLLGKDTAIKVPSMYVLAVDLTHPRLCGTLNEAEEAIERIAAMKLKVIEGDNK